MTEKEKQNQDLLQSNAETSKIHIFSDYVSLGLIAAFILIFFIGSICKTPEKVSVSERRTLATMPKLTVSSVFAQDNKKSFMSEFEAFSQDQFLGRDAFRKMSSVFQKYILLQKEMNGIYMVKDGQGEYAVKIEKQQDEKALDYAVSRMEFISQKYLGDNAVYVSFIPDKHYFTGKNQGYPSMDYDEIYEMLIEKSSKFASYIDVKSQLSLSDYYQSDSHWKQEKILPVADRLLKGMDTESGLLSPGESQLETILATDSFYGVYYGQAALSMNTDSIYYLTGPQTEAMKAYNLEGSQPKEIPIYDLKKAEDKDPYELFLDGPISLITIENPNATTEKELILFRDSFGSSIAPLLATGYQKVTLVDIRYLSPMMLDRFIHFEGADVLFLYSIPVLNTATSQFL